MKKCFDDEQEEEVEEESEDVYREVEQLKCQLELSRSESNVFIFDSTDRKDMFCFFFRSN